MPYAITIFTSAFLLFQVQPLIARYILPWFGGTPAVWSTCMLFFQVGLLLGYAYAHGISKYLTAKRQVIVHISLLAISLLLLPITPNEAWKPTDADSPIFDIVFLLLRTVGLPYILISATGPLLQQWYDKKYPGKSAYRLYALSNLGSLLGLLTYPFIVEPNMGMDNQTILWSVGYGAFILVCGWSGYLLFKAVSKPLTKKEKQAKKKIEDKSGEPEKIGWLNPIMWWALSATGSILLLATTNFVCQDVAVIPFLWVLPLSLYLITFIIAFDSPKWYLRIVWIPALIIIIPFIFNMLMGHYQLESMEIITQLVVFLGGMFLAVMVCHGEMVNLKPPTSHLTFFYLMVSVGGATGGAFVTYLAPRIFSDYWEFPIGFILTIILAGISLFLQYRKSEKNPLRILVTAGLAGSVAGAAVMGWMITRYITEFKDGVIESDRNFYGVLRVIESGENTPIHRYKLYHGQINHGIQLQDPSRKKQPAAYYGPHSGIGIAARRHPFQETGQALKVGVIGLGSGAIQCYQRPQDNFVFYEIDPDVERLARKHFSYLNDGGDKLEVVLGDGRISLERELREQGPRRFDILVVDAFSGDAIPVHLLTKEAFEIYWKHLKSNGILCIHISNNHFELEPVTYNMAQEFNMPAFMVREEGDYAAQIKHSSWTVITKNREFLDHPRVRAYMEGFDQRVETDRVLWTDDYCNVVKLLKDY